MSEDPREALARTERKLAEQRAKGRVVDRISESLHRMAEENNFVYRLAALYRGERA